MQATKHLCFAFLAVMLCGCGDASRGRGARRAAPKLTKIEVGAAVAFVEIAATPEERARGLSGRRSLGADEGMLFLFPDAAQRSFWMRNTYVPLSIAFIVPDGTISEIQDMAPETSEPHVSTLPAIMALEMRQGWFDEHGVRPGDSISLGDDFFVGDIR